MNALLNYFRNLTAFRLLLLILLAVGVGISLYGRVSGSIHGSDLSIVEFFNIVIASALIFEAVISHLGRTARGSVVDARAPVYREKREKVEGGTRRFLRDAYDFLFQYRMANLDKERIDSELRVARQIQFSLVPNTFPAYSEWREFDLYSVLSPAREVGGDYYDFFMLDSNRLVLAVGDVSGKGVPAALYMAVCRTAFRTIARQYSDPGVIMSQVNDLLIRDNHSDLYVTVACSIVDLPTGRCQYVLAGHPAPLWYDAGKGEATFVDEPRETFVGMKPGIEYPVGEMRMGYGDTLLLYSDGVTEARDRKGEDLEYDGLRQRFAALAPSGRCRDLIAGLEQSVHEFSGGREQEDDITLLAFRYWGPGGQKMLKRRGRLSARSEVHAP